MPRPPASYRGERRNAWRAIPKAERPSWRAYTAANPARPKKTKEKAQ